MVNEGSKSVGDSAALLGSRRKAGGTAAGRRSAGGGETASVSVTAGPARCGWFPLVSLVGPSGADGDGEREIGEFEDGYIGAAAVFACSGRSPRLAAACRRTSQQKA